MLTDFDFLIGLETPFPVYALNLIEPLFLHLRSELIEQLMCRAGGGILEIARSDAKTAF